LASRRSAVRSSKVAGPRGLSDQEDRSEGEGQNQSRAGDGDRGGEQLGAIGGLCPLPEQAIFLRPHIAADLGDGFDRSGGCAVAQRSYGGRDIVVGDAVDPAGEFRQALFNGLAQLGHVLDLHRVVAREPGELIEGRRNAGGRDLVFFQELGPAGQQIGPGRAFRAANFQQEGRDLILGLDRVQNPGIVFPGFVDQQDRGDADRDQYEKPRR
jgi:hypothetical protein